MAQPRIIRDDQTLLTPRRIFLSGRMLAHQLGVSRDVAVDLLIAHLGARLCHELEADEKKAGMGLSSEDLAALILASHLHVRFDVPPRSQAFREIADIVERARGFLLEYPRPYRVILIVLAANRGWHMELQSNIGPMEVDQEFARWMTLYDATILRDAVERALDVEPLRLPRATDCVVSA